MGLPSSKLQRVLSMDAREVSTRMRQEVGKRLDSIGLFPSPLKTLPRASSAEVGRFFFKPNEIPGRIRLICETIPDFEKNILAQAEKILLHQFPLLGYGSLDYGKDIDWQLDIISGKRAPLKAWPKIGYLDFNEVGDHKVTWELSRHQFLPTLAKAWLLTGDERYVRGVEAIFYDWQQKNPYPLGINWASSLEVAFRSLSWLWVVKLLSGCNSTEKLRQDMTLALDFHASYIARYLSTYFSPNTHLQGEAVALYFIGTVFPSLPNARIWRENAWKILLEHAHTKVLGDGAYFEQSTHYHVYALDFFLHARILAECNDNPFPASYDDIIKKMLGQLSYLGQAGPPPRFGDDDGGRLFDGRRNMAMHLLDPLVIGTALYRQSDYKQPGIKLTEEMLWLLGEGGLRAFSDCPERESARSAMFNNSGLFISHCSQATQSQIVFDAGALGGGSGGHGHADTLSIILNLDGKPVLVDQGAYKYMCSADSERNDFRMTLAHNTATVDGFSQTIPKTAFSWQQWAEVMVEAEIAQPGFDYFVASHNGYSRLQSAVTHRRALFNPHRGYWFVLDQLISNSSHDYALHWHLAPDSVLAQREEDKWHVSVGTSKLHILTAADGWHSMSSTAWHSPVYGVKQCAPVLSFSKHANGSEAIATLFWPEVSASPLPTLVALDHSAIMPIYAITDNISRSLFIFGDGESIRKIEGWESDAEFLFAIIDAEDLLTKVIALQSTFVRYNGRTLHQSIAKEACFKWHKPIVS